MTVQYGHFNSPSVIIDIDMINRLFNKGISKASAIALMIGAGLSLSACVSSSEAELQNPTLKIFASKQSSIPEYLWWKRYNDPQLNSLMLQAFYNSPDLGVAAGRLYKAEAQVSASKSKELPSVSLTTAFLGLSSLGGESGLDSIGLGLLNFGYELDFWGKNRAAIAATTSNANASEADSRQAMLVLSTAITASYFDLARLYDDRDITERGLTLKGENLGLVQKKYDQGLISRAELELARAGQLNARQDLAELDEQISLARNRIAALAGLDPTYGQSLKRPVFGTLTEQPLPEKVDLDLIGRRPDVVAARWRAEAASQGIRQAKAAYWPNINLMGSLVRAELGDPVNTGISSGSFGPAISLPIFNGGQLGANLKATKGEHAAALAAYNGAIINAMKESADAAASLKAQKVRLDASTEAVTAAEEAYRLAKLRYDGGLSDYPSLLLAEQTLLTQRRVNSDLKARSYLLDVALLKAVGGPF